MTELTSRPEGEADEDRRKFLAACVKFALATPPAVTVLLSTSLHSSAVARSGRRGDPMRRSGGWGGRKSGAWRRGRKSWGGRKSGGWGGRKGW
jgi:hypothetical protein